MRTRLRADQTQAYDSKDVAFAVPAIELFRTIDVNGDGAMEWDECAAYMLDAGRTHDSTAHASDRDKCYDRWELAYQDGKTPLHALRNRMRQLVLLMDMQCIAYFEEDADVVYVYALEFEHQMAPRHVATIRSHTAFQQHVVMVIAYVPVKLRLVMSSRLGNATYLSV